MTDNFLFESEGLMVVLVVMAAMIVAIAIIVMRNRHEEDSLTVALYIFERKVSKVFNPPTARQLVQIFRRQCRSARKEARRFYALTKQNKIRFIEELDHLVDFRVEFINYVEELTDLGPSTKEAVIAKLSEGEMILGRFRDYLAELSEQLR